MNKVEQQVLTLLQANPNGLRRSEIVDALDVTASTTEISRALGALVGYDKIFKFGDIYKAKSFAAAKPAASEPETEDDDLPPPDESDRPARTLSDVVRKHASSDGDKDENPEPRPFIQSNEVRRIQITIGGEDFGMFEQHDGEGGQFLHLVGSDGEFLITSKGLLFPALASAPRIQGTWNGYVVHASKNILAALKL
jgi:hypothetical protein